MAVPGNGLHPGSIVSLTETELRLLHAEDDLASEQDLLRLSQEGVDLDEARQLRADLQSAFRTLDCPRLAPGVMARLGFPTLAVGEALRHDASDSPSIADAVMSTVGDSQSSSTGVANAIGAEGGEPPALWAAVAAEIGVQADDLGGLLRDAIEAEAGESEVRWLGAPRRWWFAGAAAGTMLAVAAALLLWVGLGSEPSSMPLVAALPIDFEAPAEIESLEVGDNAVVQVLQFGENAPTIIFIDEDIEVAE